MFIAWLPFLYAELTSEEAEGKDRDLPAVDKDDSHPEAVPVAEQDPEAEQAPAEEPAAAPAEGTEAAKAPTAAQAPGEPGATAEPPAAVAPEGVAQAAAEGEDEGEDEEEGEPEPEPPVASGPVAVLRQAFERQPRDGLWAGDVEHKLRGLFGTADVPAALLSETACRSSVCRIDLKWSPSHATAYVAVYEATTRLSGTALGVEPVGEADDHGVQHVQLYVTRQGYTMADLAR